jgi:hypothetical protein
MFASDYQDGLVSNHTSFLFTVKKSWVKSNTGVELRDQISSFTIEHGETQSITLG